MSIDRWFRSPIESVAGFFGYERISAGLQPEATPLRPPDSQGDPTEPGRQVVEPEPHLPPSDEALDSRASSTQVGWYVRQLSARDAQWRDGRLDETIHHVTFTAEDSEPVSVYLVTTHGEEALVVTALQLGRSAGSGFVVRLTPETLEQFGISVSDDEQGDTDIPSVDPLHRDLVAPVSSYAKLTAALLEGILSGADVVREIRMTQQLRQIDALLESEAPQPARGPLQKARQILVNKTAKK